MVLSTKLLKLSRSRNCRRKGARSLPASLSLFSTVYSVLLFRLNSLSTWLKPTGSTLPRSTMKRNRRQSCMMPCSIPAMVDTSRNDWATRLVR